MKLTPDAVRALMEITVRTRAHLSEVGAGSDSWAAASELLDAARNALPALCADWLEMWALLVEHESVCPRAQALIEWRDRRDAMLARIRKETT